jgi:flagellar biosynthesis protein FlhF
MNIQRFTAPTAREALAKARMTFGDGTLILSNRPTSAGIEVVATGEDTLAALDRNELTRQGKRQPATTSFSPMQVDPNSQVIDDAAQLAMSTLSFQDYVRERMLRRRQEAINEQPATKVTASPPGPSRPASSTTPSLAPHINLTAQPPVRNTSKTKEPAESGTKMSQGIVDELQAMKALIEERFNTLTWLGQAKQNPIHANLMLKLIRAGYSPTLARTILERLSENAAAPEAMHWVMDVLSRNLHTDAKARAIDEEGGIFALVGATGVGKTTSAAKLAGMCARAHGANSVGLITLDTYRVGAHEQLRAYGRMLGVVAHLAHDRAALQDLLGLLAGKKMVLIDTTGIAPNDPRKRDMLGVLDLPDVNRLLVLNATSHGDTLDEVIASFKTSSAQQTILSKVDEAAKIGPVLDAVIRHQLVLRGVTMGQRVPEDWERPDAAQLVARSMRAPNKSAFDPKAADLGFFFAQSSTLAPGQFHA